MTTYGGSPTIPNAFAMTQLGHRTWSMFDGYKIVSDADAVRAQ
jgi:hypothetical protein